VALLPVGRNSLAAKLADQHGWQLVYSDNVSAVLLPPASPRLRQPLPNPDAVLGDEADWQLERAALLTEEGDPSAARTVVEGVLARDALEARGYGELANSYAREGNLAGIARAIQRGVDVEPRFTPTLRQLEASAYEAAGEPRLALAALESGVPRGPFSRPEGTLHDIERLRYALRAR